jgi:hypothetical protein
MSGFQSPARILDRTRYPSQDTSYISLEVIGVPSNHYH